MFFDTTSTTGLSGSSPTPGGGTFSGDYVAANWLWDFNDPASAHKTTKGFAVAHVFDSPGTYNVVAFVHDLAGAAGFATKTITVSAMSGTTYYVSTSGSDSANGLTTSTAFATLAHAISVGGSTNNSILLRRGDTFATASSTVLNQTGPLLFGAYVDPGHVSATKPQINVTIAAQFASAFELNHPSDLRFTDLGFNFLNSGGQGNVFTLETAVNTLAERIDLTFTSNGAMGFNGDTTSNDFVLADSNAHDFNGYAAYAASPQFAAYIGNTIVNYTTNNHAIRIQGGTNGVGPYASNTYIAENIVTPNGSISGGFGDVTERGDNTKSVIIGNTITASNGTCMTIQPQNLSSVEHVINSLVEGNTCIAPLTPFSVVAQHVYIRNNVFVGPDAAIQVIGDNAQMPAGWTTGIFIINNTAYQSDGSLGPDTYFLRHQTTSGTVTFGNNILWTEPLRRPTSAMLTSRGILSAPRSKGGHNLIYSPRQGSVLGRKRIRTWGPAASPTRTQKFVSNGTDFHLQSTSPARNAGPTSTDRVQRPLERHAAEGERLGHRRLRVQCAVKETTRAPHRRAHSLWRERAPPLTSSGSR